MTPNPPDETLEGEIEAYFRPPSSRNGLRIAHGLRIVAGLSARPECRITDYSRTWKDSYQYVVQWELSLRPQPSQCPI
eukprot:15474450-Alexandrium_andersonii.AAC.1